MRDKENIYISGCGGMLGDAFYNVFKNEYNIKCTDINLNENWLSYLNFNNYDNYLKDVKSFEADYLFHIGALTDLEYCEVNFEETYLNNTTSVENAVLIANTLDIPLLFISSAGIFDGKKEFYDDWDLPNPICHYAMSKFKAEQYIKKNISKYLICRAGWMMGGGPKKDKKFINKIVDQLKNGKKKLNIVNDKLGTPTYTIDFAKNVKLLLESQVFGTFNLVCEGFTSRVDVTNEIINFFDLKNFVEISEVPSDYFKKKYFVIRPKSERLLNKKLNKLSLNIMRDWKECLLEYLNKDYKNYLK